VDFADHGITSDADLGRDLTTAQAGDDEALQLFDALWRPGIDAHENWPRDCGGRFWTAGRARGARNRRRKRCNRESAKSVYGGAYA
jgi:hypothetical protein